VLNPLAFELRRLGLRPPRLLGSAPPARSAFAEACLTSPRTAELRARYHLEELGPLAEDELLGTCFLLDLFDRVFEEAGPPALPAALTLLDAGAKDFESAPALLQLFRHGASATAPRAVRLIGVEIDEGRVDRGARRSWGELARARLGRLGAEHRYHGGDLLRFGERCQVITWIHPFLDLETLLEWGLPARFFAPKELLLHLLSLLDPGGLLLIVNQERAESEAELELLRSIHAEHRSFEIEPFYRARDQAAFVHWVRSPR
jgi:hypothetical protein